MTRRRTTSAGEAVPAVAPLARGLALLRAFRPEDRGLGNGALAERTGLPPSTVSRLTSTLVGLGFLDYDARTGRYALTASVAALGFSYLNGLDVRIRLKPGMQALADLAGAAVALGARDLQHLVYLECCLPPRADIFRFNVGSRLPMARTAMGRAYLSGLDEERFARIVDEIRTAAGEQWPKVLAGIEKAKADIAARGFCTSFGEWESGLNAVGVPVLVNGGRDVFALSCGAPSYSLDPEDLTRLHGPRLVELVNSVSDAD